MIRRPMRTLQPMFEALEERTLLSGTGVAGNACAPDLVLDAVAEQEVRVGETLTLDLLGAGGTVEDLGAEGMPTGDAITFSLDPDVSTDTPAGATISAEGVFEWTPTAEQVGEHTIVVIATDEGPPPLADVATFSLAVERDNEPPSFELQAGVTVEENAGPQSFEEFATDISPGSDGESGQQVKFIVTPDEPDFFEEVPSISPEGTLEFTPAEGFDGETAVSVELVDNAGGRSEQQTFTVNITPGPNNPPDLEAIGDRQAAAGAEREIAVKASDPDAGDRLTFQLIVGPDSAELEQTEDNSAVIRWTPTEQQVGQSFDFAVTVLDDADPAGADSESFEVEVLPAGSEVDDGDQAGGTFLAMLWNDFLDAGRELLTTIVDQLQTAVTTVATTITTELQEFGEELIPMISMELQEAADNLVAFFFDELQAEIESQLEAAITELVGGVQSTIRTEIDRLFA